MKHSKSRPSFATSRTRPPAKSRRFDARSEGASAPKRFYTAKPKKAYPENGDTPRRADFPSKPRRFDNKQDTTLSTKRFYSAKPKARYSESTDENRRPDPASKPRRFDNRQDGTGDTRPSDTAKSKTYRAESGGNSRRAGFSSKPQRSDKKPPRNSDRRSYSDMPEIISDAPANPWRDKNDSFRRKTFSVREEHKGKDRFKEHKKNLGADKRPVRSISPVTAEKPGRDNDVLWGLHAVRAAWLNSKRKCFRLWLTEAGQKSFSATLAEAEQDLLKRPTFKLMERHELDQITPPGSVHQGIVLEAAPLHEPNLHDVISGDHPADVLLMLDQVTDPHNVGAILRSAAALGASAVIMTERNAPNTTGVLAKSASGAVEYVPQIHVVNLARALDDLQQAGYWCVGLAEEGEKNLAELDLSSRIVLVMGAEGDGLRQLTRKKCNELARLPTGGPVGSLNVSNAAAVALYETRRQKSKFNK